MQAFARLHAPLYFRQPHVRKASICTAHLSRIETPPSLKSKSRFLVLSDLHVKRESLDTCLQVLSFAHEEAIKRNAAVLFLGDFWHARGNLPVEPLNAVLRNFSKWRIPIIMIPGNHDLITRSGHGVSLVPIATTIGDQNCLLITKPTLVLEALFLPYIHDIAALKSVLKEVSMMPQRVQAIFCHAEVAGARLAERIVSKRSPRTLQPSDFPTQSRVYSGHIHRPHTVGDTIRYVGSPYQVSASESGQDKHILVLDRTIGWQIVERVPIDIGPRHFNIHYDSPFIMPDFRKGDRVVVHASSDSTKLVEGLRKAGVRVEQQFIAIPSHFSSSEEGPLASVEPRISSRALSNNDLFRQYATFKNLGPQTTKEGLELLQEIGGRYSSSLSGKDVVIRWQSVDLEGFGPFFQRVKYPVHNRGIVLVVGRDCDEEGTLTGRTNATGKTTVAMAALWAMTGRTDARPDGSVEKGVALEMVNDNSKNCNVTVKLELLGERVLSEARDMMTIEQRHQADLLDSEDQTKQQTLKVSITRTSTRNGSLSKTRSFKQGLSLCINGIDLSGLEVKETQNRIDRLVDGALLPHTVFFGQHMGAGRGLLDSTDRTLKDHLALVFPIEIWKEARRKGRAKVSKLQDLQVSSEASLKAAEAVVARLEGAKGSLKLQLDDFEKERRDNIDKVSAEIRELIAGFSRWEEDSVSYAESFATVNGSEELVRIIKELRLALRELDEPDEDDLDATCERAVGELARKNAAMEATTEKRQRALSLLERGEEWEISRERRASNLYDFLNSTKEALKGMDSFTAIDARLRNVSRELHLCDERLQELVGLSDPNRIGEQSSTLHEELQRVDAARQDMTDAHEETVRLQVSFEEVRNQLLRSEGFAHIDPEGIAAQFSTAVASPKRSIVTCDKCLRPFDGLQYEKARSRLLSQMNTLQERLSKSEERKIRERQKYEESVRHLRYQMDREKDSIKSRKKALLDNISRLRAAKDIRSSLERDVSEYSQRLSILGKESNFYIDQLGDLGFIEFERNERLDTVKSRLLEVLEEKLIQASSEYKEAKGEYEKLKSAINERERMRNHRSAQMRALQEYIDELHSLQVRCRDLETERRALVEEGNPYEESLKLMSAELIREKDVVLKRKVEFQQLSSRIEVLKALDTAFGPRGVPSFVLEEGLTRLEKLADDYLQKLSAGELILQIRAFSDYKSSNRNDGDNKEVISKRIFVRTKGSRDIRERSLRQLSGGQRQRCSLSFALAFSDLAHECAGFQSSLIVLDEILQSLDNDGRQRMSRLIPNLISSEDGIRNTVLVVAQDEAPEIAAYAHGGTDVVERKGDLSRLVIDNQGPH